MPVTHFNLSLGDIIPQPGFAPQQNENGGWEATRDYYMLQATWETSTARSRFAIGQSISSADGTIDSYFSFLTIQGKEISYEEGELAKLTVRYTGQPSAQYSESEAELSDESLPTYRLDGRLTELSLSKHPKWSTMSLDEQRALGGMLHGLYFATAGFTAVGHIQDDGAIVLARNESGVPVTWAVDSTPYEFCKRIALGQTTYMVPAITWTEVAQGNIGMNTAQLNLLGNISTPRGGPPNPSGSRNWMLTSASQEQRGELYQTTIEWTLSEREGWDAFLYTD